MNKYTKKFFARRNKFSVRARNARNRAKKLGISGVFTKRTIENLYVKQSGRCACGCQALLHGVFDVDHIRPLSKGGDNTAANLQLLKPFCNKTKGAKYE